MLLINFIILQAIVFGVVIYFLRRIFYGDTQSAINRLEGVHQDLMKKQKDLEEKITAAEKVYTEKKQEAETVADKTKTEAVNEIRQKQDEMMKKAKKEADELVDRAKLASEKHYREIEKQVRMNLIETAANLLLSALSHRSVEMVHHQLVKEFIDGGKDMDLTTVREHIDKLIVKTPMPLTKEEMLLLDAFIRGKLNRKIEIEEIVDPTGIAGIALQFGTLIIDSSLANYIRDASQESQQAIKKESLAEEEQKPAEKAKEGTSGSEGHHG